MISGRSKVAALAAGVLILAAAAGSGSAQEPAATEQHEVSLFKFLVKDGGPITWFILMPLSVVMLALIVEHCVSIRRAAILPAAAWEQIESLVKRRRYRDAAAFTADEPSTLSYVVHAALAEAARGHAAMERAVGEAVETRAANMLRKIEYLHVIGSVSPMIGLFGTVLGMMLAFDKLVEQSAGGSVNPGQLAYGIRTALVTTFWGLLIAIPALAAFAIFRNRIDRLSGECVMAVETLLTALRPEAVQPPAPAPVDTGSRSSVGGSAGTGLEAR